MKFAVLSILAWAGSAMAALHPGDLLPEIAGQTVSGQSLALPAAAAGQTTVVLFSFSRAAGNDSRLWSERLSKDFAPDRAPAIYVAILLESVPTLFRGMALSGIKSSMPAAAQSRTLVLYRDEDLWKRHLAVSIASHSYVVLLDAHGLIRWMGSRGFNDADYARLRGELTTLLPAPG